MVNKTKTLNFMTKDNGSFVADSTNINNFVKNDNQSYLVIPIDKLWGNITKDTYLKEGHDSKKLQEIEKLLLSSLAKVGARALLESIAQETEEKNRSLYDDFYDGFEKSKHENNLKINNMKEFILNDSKWLDSSQLSKKASLKNQNASAGPSNWKSRKKIFAIHHENKNLYPTYCLDAGYHPLKIVKDILEIFDESYSGWYLAYWFGLPNSFLSGDKPKDVLNYDNYERIIRAAKAAKDGLSHG